MKKIYKLAFTVLTFASLLSCKQRKVQSATEKSNNQENAVSNTASQTSAYDALNDFYKTLGPIFRDPWEPKDDASYAPLENGAFLQLTNFDIGKAVYTNRVTVEEHRYPDTISFAGRNCAATYDISNLKSPSTDSCTNWRAILCGTPTMLTLCKFEDSYGATGPFRGVTFASKDSIKNSDYNAATLSPISLDDASNQKKAFCDIVRERIFPVASPKSTSFKDKYENFITNPLLQKRAAIVLGKTQKEIDEWKAQAAAFNQRCFNSTGEPICDSLSDQASKVIKDWDLQNGVRSLAYAFRYKKHFDEVLEVSLKNDQFKCFKDWELRLLRGYAARYNGILFEYSKEDSRLSAMVTELEPFARVSVGK